MNIKRIFKLNKFFRPFYSFFVRHFSVEGSNFALPLQNPTPGVLAAERGNVLGYQTGLWSREAKV
jgi:hypothetical protein